MIKICLGCGKEFLSPTPFVEFCEKCLKERNYKPQDEKRFNESYSEMCDYCNEIDEAMARMEMDNFE